MNIIMDHIEALKHNTSTSLKNVQGSKIPAAYNMIFQKKGSYLLNGTETRIYESNKIVFLIDNLPIRKLTRCGFIDTMKNMVDKKEIQPFLIFLNGSFIKWSNIKIIVDHKYNYILIDNCTIQYPTPLCVLLPVEISYLEGAINTSSSTVFIFNSLGQCVNNIAAGNIHTTININETDVYYESGNMTGNTKKALSINSKYKISNENLLIFQNGYLLPTNLTHHGLNIVTPNYTGIIAYKLFYYIYANESKDNILAVKNEQYLYDKILSSSVIPEYITELNTPFDFKFDKSKTYTENIQASLEYIMSYNPSLMNKVYEKSANIISRTYTGTDIRAIKDPTGYVTMSRRIDGVTDNYVMIFVNSILYEYYNMLKYIGKNFKFPALYIQDTDTIEILYFKNVDNRISKLQLYSGLENEVHVLDSTININNMKLFSTEVPSHLFDIPSTELAQYEVEFTATRTAKDKARIIPTDSFYFDRVVTMASSRQFRYFSMVIKEDVTDLRLSEDFSFCNNASQYIVFINGRKIDKDDYRLTLVKNTRPFTDISLYLGITLHQGYKLEVFYVPDSLEEVVCTPRIPLSGNIIVDKSKVSYNLSKNLYFIFANGKKINNANIIDMSSTKMRIINDIGTLNNLCIVKHISDNDVISTMFNTTTNEFDQSIDVLSPGEIDNLYPMTNTILDREMDIDAVTIPVRTVLSQIVQDYWMKPNILNKDQIFVYDYDESIELDVDTEGNIIMLP